MVSDQEMLDRIAHLTNAIELQKSRARGGYHGHGRGGYRPPPFQPTYRPPVSSSYRGRGGNLTLSNTNVRPNMYQHHRPVYNPTNMYRTPVRPSPPTSHNRSLVLNGKPTTTYPSIPLPKPKSHHRKLIINHKDNSTNTNTVVKSVDAVTGRKQVAIDGVDFVVKGKKLIRKDLFDSNTTLSNAMLNAPKVLVRRSMKSLKRRDKNQNMVIGKAPLVKRVNRNKKGGNMVFVRGPEGYVRQGRSGKSLVLNSHKKTLKKPRYCGFYTRYGKCPNAGHCPFVHDPHRRAICPRFLQNRCQKNPCKLSHTPNDHIMPHCVHFQRAKCKNDPCMYMHVKVSSDAPVCKSFAMEGYCPKGIDCAEKHVHVCPEFAETGKCSNANCRLPHVARRTNTTEKQAGIVRLGSWVSPQYFYQQKMAKTEKRKAIEDATAAKVWTRPELIEEKQQQDVPVNKEEVREVEEQQGFIRLFNDSDDDDGWSQFERSSEAADEDIQSLRFNEEEEEEDDDDDEEDLEEENENENNEEKDNEEEDMDEDSEGEFQDAEEYLESDMHDNQVGHSDEEQSDDEEIYEEVSDTEMSDE